MAESRLPLRLLLSQLLQHLENQLQRNGLPDFKGQINSCRWALVGNLSFFLVGLFSVGGPGGKQKNPLDRRVPARRLELPGAPGGAAHHARLCAGAHGAGRLRALPAGAASALSLSGARRTFERQTFTGRAVGGGFSARRCAWQKQFSLHSRGDLLLSGDIRISL